MDEDRRDRQDSRDPRDRRDRRTLIADTVVAVLASAGARGLTHRAVDAAAGLPAGSTSYYFRTRDALLSAAARRLADLDFEEAAELPPPPATPAGLASLLAALVLGQATAHRDRTLALYELALEAARIPAVAEALTAQATRFEHAATALLTALGTTHPAEDARAVITACSGLLYEATVGGRRPPTSAEATALLTAVIESRLPRTGPAET